MRPQTTRRAIRGIATDTEAERQLVLVDLPGVQRPRDVLTERMQHRVERELAESDVALLVVNGEEGVGPGDRFIARSLLGAGTETHTICAVNKADRTGPNQLVPVLAEAAELEGVDEVFPVSARSGEGLDVLVERLGELVPEGPYMYPPQDQQRPVERAAPRRADPRAGPEPDPRGDPALGRGLGRRGHRARRRPGHCQGRDLGRDRVPEGHPDREGRLEGGGDRRRRAPLARGRARRPGPPRPPGQPPPPLAPGRGSVGSPGDRIGDGVPLRLPDARPSQIR